MIKELTVRGAYAENTYFYIDDRTRAGFLIDPGAEAARIFDIIVREGWTIEKILLTHGHFDHTGAAAELSRMLRAPIYIYPDDAPYLTDTYLNLSGQTRHPVVIEHYEEVADGETIRLRPHSGIFLKVIHTPGHTPGSVVYYAPEARAAFVGDTLYEHGPGLTNFPGGDVRKLEQSIVDKVLTLPLDTVLLSGHSSPITVADQRRLLGLRP